MSRNSEIKIRENLLSSLNNTYQITGKIEPNFEVIESDKNRGGRFIIATNRLDHQSFSCDEMLRKYKVMGGGVQEIMLDLSTFLKAQLMSFKHI